MKCRKYHLSEMKFVFCITDINYDSFAFFSLFCQGIKARILETFVMLFLLALLILGIVWVASALIDNDAASMESLYGMCLKESVLFILINIFQGIFENTIWEMHFFAACKVGDQQD